jgi:hypothetical protein
VTRFVVTAFVADRAALWLFRYQSDSLEWSQLGIVAAIAFVLCLQVTPRIVDMAPEIAADATPADSAA